MIKFRADDRRLLIQGQQLGFEGLKKIRPQLIFVGPSYYYHGSGLSL